MARSVVFWTSICAAALAAVFTVICAKWMLWADAPEMVQPLLTGLLAGATAFVLAAGTAVFTRRKATKE